MPMSAVQGQAGLGTGHFRCPERWWEVVKKAGRTEKRPALDTQRENVGLHPPPLSFLPPTW
jgi:hypothetical protein